MCCIVLDGGGGLCSRALPGNGLCCVVNSMKAHSGSLAPPGDRGHICS